MSVKAIPEGYHSIQPYLYIRGAAQALDFYRKAFGAQTIVHMPGPDGRVMHAEMRFGDSVIMMADESPERGVFSPEYYKGAPGGGYRSYVYTDALSAERLVELRDAIERDVRGVLGIPWNPAKPAIRYEHSMGQGPLPSFLARSTSPVRPPAPATSG